MGVLTQAMYHARELAMTRMEEEADQLGADGVVGVRLAIGRYEWGADLAEFLAIGTAVKRTEGVTTVSPQLPPQAIIRDKDTWVNGRGGFDIQSLRAGG